MLVDRYTVEDVFVRVPELAGERDPVLCHLDPLLADEPPFQMVRADLMRWYPQTADHGRHSTPVEVNLRLFVMQHLYAWSYPETVGRVADSLVLRWFARVYFQVVPNATTLLRWAQTVHHETLQVLLDRVSVIACQVRVTQGRQLRLNWAAVQSTIHHPTDSSLLTDGVRVLNSLACTSSVRKPRSQQVSTPFVRARSRLAERIAPFVVVGRHLLHENQRMRTANAHLPTQVSASDRVPSIYATCSGPQYIAPLVERRE
jgi:IS5 family transposase